MTRLKLFVLLWALPAFILAQTQIEAGAVSGTWLSANSPYEINGDISIPVDANLTIEPGTEVYFTGEYQFDVFGQLIAEGTETDSIYFHSDSLGTSNTWPYYAGFWYGITFHATDSTGQIPSSLDYCRISYGYERWLDEASLIFNRRFGGGLLMYKSSVYVSNTVIEESANDGLVALYATGDYNNVILKDAGNLELLYSTIGMQGIEMTRSGGMILTHSQIEISDSKLHHNNNTYNNHGVFHADSSTVQMRNCEISDNSAAGLMMLTSNASIEHTLIQRNQTYGALFLESPSTLIACEIVDNNGIGMMFNSSTDWQTTFTSEIMNTVVARNNGTGIKFISNNNADITNCTIVDNSNSNGWGGITNGNIDTHIKNSIIYNNGNDLNFQAGGLYTYSIIQGNYTGQSEATSNLDNYDPVFRDEVSGDYHLQSTDCVDTFNSPGIDAGDPAIADYILDCASAGLGTEVSDIGAYGGVANRWDDMVLPSCHYAGDVSGIWDCEDIYLESDVTIPAGDTLQILNSVSWIHILGSYEIKVEGVLIAIGPESETVNAHSDYIKFQGSDWHGITFNNLNESSQGSSIIENCRFDYADKLNADYPNGGAILIYNSDDVLVRHSFFYSNRAVLGGAIYVENADPVIEDCKFEINGRILSTELEIMTSAGGAIYLKNANPSLWKLQFAQNGANDGGAIFLENSSPRMANMLLVKNEATGFAGGIFMSASSPHIVNMTAADNFAANGGGAFSLMSVLSQPEVINSIMFGNSKPEIYINEGVPTVRYSILDSASTETYFGTGCLDEDPQFLETIGDVYRLPSTDCGVFISSAAIDAGHPDSLDAVLNCSEGLGSQRADMGYYGGRYSPDIVLGVNDSDRQIPLQFALSQNYPNPFNPSTLINFSIPQSSQVKLVIFNTLGQEIQTLVDQMFDGGYHSVNFDASSLNSGIYFYRISADNFSASRKMILLK